MFLIRRDRRVNAMQGVELEDLFDPTQAAEPFKLGPRFELWQLIVGDNGDMLMGDDRWDFYTEGTPESGEPQHQTGIRMVTVLTQAGTTPTA